MASPGAPESQQAACNYRTSWQQRIAELRMLCLHVGLVGVVCHLCTSHEGGPPRLEGPLVDLHPPLLHQEPHCLQLDHEAAQSAPLTQLFSLLCSFITY